MPYFALALFAGLRPQEITGDESINLIITENRETQKEEVNVDFSNIRRAKLILTDKLINASKNSQI